MPPRNNGLEDKALRLIMESEDGILQCEMWKRLGLSSREGSRLAQRFEEKGEIERNRVLHEGRWTYKLYSKRRHASLASIRDSPCLKCDDIDRCFEGGERSPISCEQLTKWIMENSERGGRG